MGADFLFMEVNRNSNANSDSAVSADRIASYKQLGVYNIGTHRVVTSTAGIY